MTHTEETKRTIKQAAIDREHKKIMANRYVCHKCGKTTDCVRANDHLCMKCVDEWYLNKINGIIEQRKKNEAQFQCPHCARVNFQEVKILKNGDDVVCIYCKKYVIITSMVYILQTRVPE